MDHVRARCSPFLYSQDSLLFLGLLHGYMLLFVKPIWKIKYVNFLTFFCGTFCILFLPFFQGSAAYHHHHHHHHCHNSVVTASAFILQTGGGRPGQSAVLFLTPFTFLLVCLCSFSLSHFKATLRSSGRVAEGRKTSPGLPE